MVYGTEVIMRGGRYFDYKRVEDIEQTESGGRIIWKFTCRGIYEPRSEYADKDGFEALDPGYIRGAIISAATESEAVEQLRLELNPNGVDYNCTRWDLERIGVDTRPATEPVIIQLQR